MTELYERSLTDRREALAKRRPVLYWYKTDFGAELFCRLIILSKKTQKIQKIISFKTSFPLL